MVFLRPAHRRRNAWHTHRSTVIIETQQDVMLATTTVFLTGLQSSPSILAIRLLTLESEGFSCPPFVFVSSSKDWPHVHDDTRSRRSVWSGMSWDSSSLFDAFRFPFYFASGSRSSFCLLLLVFLWVSYSSSVKSSSTSSFSSSSPTSTAATTTIVVWLCFGANSLAPFYSICQIQLALYLAIKMNH